MSEDVEMKPIAPEEVGAVPPKVDLSAVASAPAASTVKLKPIIRRPVIRKPVIGGAKPVVLKPASGVPPAPAAVPEAAAEAKKPEPAVKPVQDAMPAQAILHKTGIIAEGILTPAQAQAAKTKTSRISLESAIGVAPTIKSGAPMKTIKLRRLTDIPPAPGAVKIDAAKPTPAAAPVAPAPAPAEVASAAAPAASESAKPEAEPAPAQPLEKPATVTQKKTLKLQRPGFKRPTVSGLKRPGAPAAPMESKPAADAGVADLSGEVAELSPVSEIADIKPMPPVADLPDDSSATVAGVPSWLNISTILAGVAALIVMSLCTWTLFREAAGPAAGPNDLATFHSDTDYRR